MAKLVLVHGRGQQGKEPERLKKEWTDALGYGCLRAGVDPPATGSIEFPFYGDLLADLVEQMKTPRKSSVLSKGPSLDSESAMRGEIIAELLTRIGLDQSDVSRELRGLPQEKGPGNWEWVQAMLRALDRVPGLSSKVVDAFTRDAYVYLAHSSVRRKIDAIVNEAIGSESAVVVGHSLGSVVAYNILYRRRPNPACPRFITLGSPLGLKAFKNRIEAPLKSPPCVGHWFNAFDDRDFVALTPLDAAHFNVDPPIENKDDVINFTDNRHGIEGYLADPVVASRIIEYLDKPSLL